MGVSTKYLQDLFEVQVQQNNDQKTKFQNLKLQLNFNQGKYAYHHTLKISKEIDFLHIAPCSVVKIIF
jgi:hypothetical protein